MRENPKAEVFAISAQAKQGVVELLRELAKAERRANEETTVEEGEEAVEPRNDLPVISLSAEQLSKAWRVEKVTENGETKYVVSGPKIEKFARRTDLDNYASVNRLRDILKKMGIRAELTSQGAEPDSIVSIAGKEFTLVEDY